MDYTTRKMLHIKELGPLIMEHFSRPRYIILHNSHKSDIYFLNIGDRRFRIRTNSDCSQMHTNMRLWLLLPMTSNKTMKQCSIF